MRLKLFGGRVTIGKDLSPYAGQADNYFGFMQQRYGTDYRVRNRLKAYKNVVFGCTSLIGDALCDYIPYLEQKRGDTWERVDHEFINLLRQPSGRFDPNDPRADSFSGADLWKGIGIYQILQGDAFIYLATGKTTGRPREIMLLRADKVGTDIDPKTGKVNGYFIRQEVGDPIPLEIREVLRFPEFNPENPYKGKSIIEAGSDYIETDEGTAEYTKNFFKNGAGISGVLNVKGEVTKGAFRKFVRAWREKYEGVDNAGKIAVLRDSDANFQKIGLGLNELDMSGLRKMSMEEVFMMFRVPPPLLGKMPEGSGFGRNNIEALEYNFAKWNIDKRMTRFDRIIEFALQRYYGLEPAQYRVCHENIIPDDKDHELAELTAGVDKWITRNEARGEDEAPDIDGGDQLYVPINMLPLNEAGQTTTPATTSTSGAKEMKVKIIRRTKTKDAKKDFTPTQIERFRLTIMRNQMRYEKQYRRMLKPVWKKQRKEALNNLEAHAGSLKKDANQHLFDDASYDALITEMLQPVLQDLAKTQGGLAMTFAGSDDNEFYLTDRLSAALKSGTAKMATNFNDETIAALNDTLMQGIQEGEGLSELKKRVNGVYDDIEGYRSERIARTETLKAGNAASVDAYRQTGFVTAKAWVVNPDACGQCLEFEGKTIGLDDTFLGLGESYSVTDENGDETVFTNNYDDVEEPPLHPNCRCVIIPVS
jgi:HK97 family phage portal protein